MKSFIIYLKDRPHSVSHSQYMLDTLSAYGLNPQLFDGITGYEALKKIEKDHRRLYPFSIKNKELTERAFTQDEYYNLSDGFSDEIKGAFSKYSNAFNFTSLKHIAASGFFQNLVYLNEDAYSFWGKPTVQCTKYQI